MAQKELTKEERITRHKERIEACTSPIHGMGFFGVESCGKCDACKQLSREHKRDPNIEWRLKLKFCYLDPNLEVIYPDGNQEWSEDEPYVETRSFQDEDLALKMLNEAREILARDDASDMVPSQAQQDFPIKHEFEMRDIDGNNYGAKLALTEVVEFIKVENIFPNDTD